MPDIAPEYSVGDLVKLRSGGPVMTVQEVFGDESVRCQWFAGAKANSELFPVDSLTRPTEDEVK